MTKVGKPETNSKVANAPFVSNFKLWTVIP